MVMRRQASIVANIAPGGGPSSVRMTVQPVSSITTGYPSKSSNVYIGNNHSNGQLAVNEASNAASESNAGNQSSPPSRPSSRADDNNMSRTSNTGCRVSHSQQREKRIFITLTYVLFSYLICWFPFYIAFDTYAWKPDLVPAGLYSFFFWSTYVNSTLNPFIYAFTNKEFRLAFIKVLKRMFRLSK